MMKEAWNSFKDNIKDRITNPFLGTFVVVWIAHNWQVVYSFFYFDKDWKLENKIQYFKNYWTDRSFFWNLICVAAITIVVLIITYIFLSLSRYLANVFENVIIPIIQKKTKGKIVTNEVYQIAIDRISYLETKVEEERRMKNEAIRERDDFEKRVYGDDRVMDGGEIADGEDETIRPKKYEAYSREYNTLKNTKELYMEFQKIAPKAQRELKMFTDGNNINIKLFDYFLANDIIERSSVGVYRFTEKGQYFNKQLLDDTYVNKSK